MHQHPPQAPRSPKSRSKSAQRDGVNGWMTSLFAGFAMEELKRTTAIPLLAQGFIVRALSTAPYGARRSP